MALRSWWRIPCLMRKVRKTKSVTSLWPLSPYSVTKMSGWAGLASSLSQIPELSKLGRLKFENIGGCSCLLLNSCVMQDDTLESKAAQKTQSLCRIIPILLTVSWTGLRKGIFQDVVKRQHLFRRKDDTMKNSEERPWTRTAKQRWNWSNKSRNEAQGTRKDKAVNGQRRPIMARLAGAKSHGWVRSTKDNNITAARLQAPVMGCRPRQRLTRAFRSFWDLIPTLTLTEWELDRSTQEKPDRLSNED